MTLTCTRISLLYSHSQSHTRSQYGIQGSLSSIYKPCTVLYSLDQNSILNPWYYNYTTYRAVASWWGWWIRTWTGRRWAASTGSLQWSSQRRWACCSPGPPAQCPPPRAPWTSSPAAFLDQPVEVTSNPWNYRFALVTPHRLFSRVLKEWKTYYKHAHVLRLRDLWAESQGQPSLRIKVMQQKLPMNRERTHCHKKSTGSMDTVHPPWVRLPVGTPDNGWSADRQREPLCLVKKEVFG